MRSRNEEPGSCVICTTMRSESTRVPPVTALRSPPDSRMTGADSPVIADSSTDAIPSMTVPSPGIVSPAMTTTTSPRSQLAGGSRRAVGHRRDRIRAHRAQRGRLRAAAALGERLGEVREDDGQPQPDRDGEREPGWVVAAAERRAAEDLDQPRDGRHERADLDDEHDRVADLDARVELDERLPDGGAQLLGGHRGTRSIARLSSRTFTPGSPATAAKRPSVFAVDQRVHAGKRHAADGGDPMRLDAGVGERDVRIDAAGRRRDGVDGDPARRQAGIVRALEREIGRECVSVEVARGRAVRAAVGEERRRRAVAGGGRAGLEVARVGLARRGVVLRLAAVEHGSGEGLGDEPRADDPAVARDLRAVRRARERELRDARDRERVAEPERDREQRDGDDRGASWRPHQKSLVVRPWTTGPSSRAGKNVSAPTRITTPPSMNGERRRVGAHRAEAGGGDAARHERAGDREHDEDRDVAAEQHRHAAEQVGERDPVRAEVARRSAAT